MIRSQKVSLSSKFFVGSLFAACVLGAFARSAIADGTELLAKPVGLTVAPGAHVVAAGAGIRDGGSPDIHVVVPAGATVRQVLAYWEGLDWNPTDHGTTTTLKLNGVLVTGKNIGGPSELFGSAYSTTFRADVTSKNLVHVGANTVTVSEMNFTRFNNGAGLVVVYDLANDRDQVAVQDGNDVASIFLGPPGDKTQPVTFQFDPSDEPRTADLAMFFSAFFPDRATILRFSIDGVVTESLVDAIGHADNAAWDTVHRTVAVPPGAKSLTVEALNENSGVGPFLWNGPGKFIWMFCGLELEAPKVAGEGCTPGFWLKNCKRWDGCGTNDLTDHVRTYLRFNDVMNVNVCQSWLPSCARLCDVLWLPGCGIWALNREAVAALCNADADLDYPYTVAQVISIYRDAVGAKAGPETVQSALAKFKAANELGCPFCH